jgi:hypothetical protein
MDRGCATRGDAIRLGLCFEGGNYAFFHLSVHFASMIDNIVLEVKYFWTLKKTKCYSTVDKCSS